MELNKIYNENCLDTIKEMNDNFVDLTITSPPYDDLRMYNGYSFPFEDIAKGLYKVTKPGGIVVWVVGDALIDGSESGTSFKQALFFKSIGFNLHDTMIYKKAGPRFPEKIRYSQIFEYMFVFSKGKPKTVNIIKDRKNIWAGYTNWGTNSNRLKNGKIVKTNDAKRYRLYGSRFNIWEYSNGYGFGTKDKKAYFHPAQFPEKLALDHIISWSNENDIVYDPMMGSGTVAKMAILTNRNYIGSEISQEYVQSANERIKELDIKRGEILHVLKEQQNIRDEDENNHTKKVSENEKNYNKSGKKWQPPVPIDNIKILSEMNAWRNSILSQDTE